HLMQRISPEAGSPLTKNLCATEKQSEQTEFLNRGRRLPFDSEARMIRSIISLALSFFSGIALFSSPSRVAAQAQYIVQPVAETKVKQLPKGELFWRVESFPTLDKAKAAAPPYRWNPDTVSYDGLPSLAAEVAGKAWLFTLGPKGGATAAGTKVAEIGPVPPLSAPEYLLRVNHGHWR